MYGKVKEHLATALENLKAAGLYKEERIIESPQQAAIQVNGKEVLNFCANNYLGLSNNPRLIEGAKKMMDRRGFGMSSVRFICGTQDSWRLPSQNTSRQKTPSCMLPASTPTEVSSARSLPTRTPSSLTPSTTLPSSTAYASARLSVIVTPTPTWKSWRNAFRRLRSSASASSAQTAYSQWTAMWLLSTRSATSLRSMTLS